MAGHGHHAHLDRDVTQLKPGAKTLGISLIVIGLVGVIAAAVTASSGQRFWFAYMTGFCAVTAVSCSGLIFMLIAHLVKSGWVTNVRRLQETIALNILVCFALAIPVIIVTLKQDKTIYSWAVPSDTPIVHHGEHHDEGHDKAHDAHAAPAEKAADAHEAKPEAAANAHGEKDSHAKADNHDTHAVDPYFQQAQVGPGVARAYDANIAEKRSFWLNPFFWSFRIIVYFGVLSGVVLYIYRHGIRQDHDGDVDHTYRNMNIAAPALLACALAVTFIAFDVFMTLDPHWFSTMFGVYFFASGTQAMWSIIALSVLILQARGYLRESVTEDNRHDIGKFMFAFIVFFAYIAYSQYMLQWYANLPEETFWFDKRGYSTAHPNGYSPLVIVLLIGRFVIPFLGFVSRWVKRSRFGLGFWAVWLLAMFAVDMYLVVQPEWSTIPHLGATEILAFGGISVLWVGNYIRQLATQPLRALHDPRTEEAVAIHNI